VLALLLGPYPVPGMDPAGRPELRAVPASTQRPPRRRSRRSSVIPFPPMQLLTPSPEAARAGLRAMKHLASADGPMGAPTRNLLRAVQTHVLRLNEDLDALDDITPEGLAAAMTDPAVRRQFAQGMAVVSLADGKPGPKKVAAMERYARALGVASDEVDVLRGLVDHHAALFKLDFLRRSHIADMARQQFERSGFVGAIKAFAGFRGAYEEPERAARYRALGHLPAGTFGRAYFDYIQANGYSFPGEKHAFPEAGIYHDLTHVLSGYGTDSAGEVQIGGFVAGFRKERPVFVILFVMLTFSAGINVTPIDQPLSVGILETPGLAEAFVRAVQRGSAVNTDLSDHWDHWPFMEKDLEAVRRELNILPER
jgi:hypothetical protein